VLSNPPLAQQIKPHNPPDESRRSPRRLRDKSNIATHRMNRPTHLLLAQQTNYSQLTQMNYAQPVSPIARQNKSTVTHSRVGQG
jgi:hypothetical protein